MGVMLDPLLQKRAVLLLFPRLMTNKCVGGQMNTEHVFTQSHDCCVWITTSFASSLYCKLIGRMRKHSHYPANSLRAIH